VTATLPAVDDNMAQVHFLGGPADGAIRMMTAGADGLPPEMVLLRGGEVYPGSDDTPAPPELAVYERLPAMPAWCGGCTGTRAH
jgi:hypothetical protein